MNANELINKLKLVRCMAGDGHVLNEAEAMILQQQAEIEALKKEAALQRLSDFTQEAEIEALKERNAYLEAQVYGGSTK